MAEPSNDAAQYLAFRLAGSDFAIPIQRIREIVECGSVTRVPNAPACVRGVTNLRGSVIPVIDLAIKFGLSALAITRWTCLVIIEVDFKDQWTAMGVLADSVTEVVDLGPGEIEPAPSFGTQVQSDYLAGLGKLGTEFVLLLDVEKLLSPSELTTTLALPDVRALGEANAPEAGAARAGKVAAR